MGIEMGCGAGESGDGTMGVEMEMMMCGDRDGGWGWRRYRAFLHRTICLFLYNVEVCLYFKECAYFPNDTLLLH